MSSILKALQKLESETLEKGTGQSWLHNFNAGQKAPGKPGRIRSKALFGLLCIVLMISGSAAFMFMQREPAPLTSISGTQPVQGPGTRVVNNASARTAPGTDKAIGATQTDNTAINSDRPPEIAIPHADDAPSGAAGLDGVSQSGTPERKPAGVRHGARGEKTDPEKPLGPAAARVKAVSSAGPKNSAPFPEPLEPARVSMQPDAMENLNNTSHANQEESAYNTGRETAEALENQISLKRIQTPDIKLHAISWTPDVKTRIAVINGSIVREGDTISRYRVSKINKDDIILSEGGELWRLAFRGR